MVINELYSGSALDEELERIKRELRVISRKVKPQPTFRSWGEALAVGIGFSLCVVSLAWCAYGVYLLAMWIGEALP